MNHQVIAKLATAKVLVVGDVMLDRYWHGGVDRISPEAPVPVVHVSTIENRAGGAANVAVNIAMLGGTAQLFGYVGNDEAGELLKAASGEFNVKNQLITLNGQPTITKLRVLSRHQQLIRLDFEDDFHEIDNTALLAELRAHYNEAHVLLLSDYGKGVLSNPQSFIRDARAAGLMVLVDPKSKDFSIYQGATLLTPNQKEFEAVVGKCKNEDEMIERGWQLVKKLNLQALLVTRGEHGMLLLETGREPLLLPAQARDVYDVTGAGDTVIALLATGLAADLPLGEAARLANIAAGLVVAKVGTAGVTPEELMEAMHHLQPTTHGTVSEEILLALCSQAKKRGERVVMTNGCFDILHPGHITYLEQAKALGDRLIVAVNTDESVQRLKGESRPINSLADRMAVLAGLQSVDWVVPFSEDTPERLISTVLPDILVKGGDYRVEQIAGAKAVLANGGDVQILTFVDGCSTSNMIKRIIEKECSLDGMQ